MAGNSRRQGARRTGTKKGPTVGTGGQRRRGLEGRGPTPPADQRPGHPASRRPARVARPPARRGPGPGGGTELVAGRNPVAEALRAGVPASTLYVAIGVELDDRVADSVRLAGDRGLTILEVDRRELDRLVGGSSHQGIGLRVPAYEYAHPDDVLARAQDGAAAALLVALDGVTDPRNLGAVVRSAAAFGAHGVVVPERRSAGMTAAAWRASAGTAARLPVAKATNLTRALTTYQGAGLLAVGLDSRGEVNLDDLVAAVEPLVLVVGSEGRGLSRLVGERCDLRVAIPMAARTESLNASAAAAVALAEIARRRRAG